MTDSDAFEWPDPSDKANSVEQAKWLRNQVAEGGLRFKVYLPPCLGRPKPCSWSLGEQ